MPSGSETLFLLFAQEVGTAEIQRGLSRTDAAAPTGTLYRLLNARGEVEEHADLLVEICALRKTAADDDLHGCVAVIVNAAVIINNHHCFAEGTVDIVTAEEAALHAHLSLLNEGHYHHLGLGQHIYADGIYHGFFLEFGFLGCSSLLFASLLHLCGLGLKEGCACHANVAVAEVVNGENVQTAGGCQLVISYQQSLGDRPKLHDDVVNSVLVGSVPQFLTGNVIIGDRHGEVHIHVGVHYLIHLLTLYHGNGDLFGQCLSGAKGEHNFAYSLEIGRGKHDVKSVRKGAHVAYISVLHRTNGCVHLGVAQNLSLGAQLHFCNAYMISGKLDDQCLTRKLCAHIASSVFLYIKNRIIQCTMQRRRCRRGQPAKCLPQDRGRRPSGGPRRASCG